MRYYRCPKGHLYAVAGESDNQGPFDKPIEHPGQCYDCPTCEALKKVGTNLDTLIG
jgi:hypothetical protein